MSRRHLMTLGALLLAACDERGAGGPGVAVSVAPLGLAGVHDAVFTITVENGANPREVVWSESGLRSVRYGDGRGSLTYIGPCDAAEPDNLVSLVLEGLYTRGDGGELVEVPTDSYVNPTVPTAVSLGVTCEENRDVPVVFNLVIARDADQGFFDVAVNFEDVFCSAKLDCKEELLHDGLERALTFITAFACTSGGSDPTWLYLDDFEIQCADVDGTTVTPAPPVTIDPGQDPGQHGPIGEAVFEHAVYAGDEDFEDFDKCYWNVAIGVELAYLQGFDRCSIVGKGSAGTQRWPGNATPPRTTYPVIEWSAEIWNSALSPMLQCFNRPLDGSPAGVETGYTDGALPDGTPFDNVRGCQPEVVVCTVPIVGSAPGQEGSADVTVTGYPGDSRIEISALAGGANVSATFLLPDYASYAPRLEAVVGCCGDSCCAEIEVELEPGPEPIVDGVRDASYGTPRAVQTVETGFGDNSSELNAAYASIANGRLFLLLTGNLEPNFNNLYVFFDTLPGGENTLGGAPTVDGIDRLGGLTFDLGFTTDYQLWLDWGEASGVQAFVHMMNRQGGTQPAPPTSMNLDFVATATGFAGQLLAPSPALTAPLLVALDNSNVAGIVGGSGPADQSAAAAVTTGVELSIALVDLGNPPSGTTIRITAMVGGAAHDYLSNQVLSGLPSPHVNLGGDGSGGYTGTLSGINFDLIPGDQYIEITVP